MPSARAVRAEPDALICERCGYALAGLTGDEPCPECGQAARESWPDRRPGTLWQRGVSGVWLRVNASSLFTPGSVFRSMTITRTTSHGSTKALLHMNLMLTAGCVVLGWLWAGGGWFASALPMWIGFYAGLWVLTWIEARGLIFFGCRRGWRITPTVAWAICDHASVGWLVGGLLTLAVWIIDVGGRLAYAGWANDLARWLGWSPLSQIDGLVRACVFAGALLIGMLLFETLVYVGMLRCRFANTPASAVQAAGAKGGVCG